MAGRHDRGSAVEKEESDDDSLYCDVCKIGFEVSKAYFQHIYSVSHLRNAQNVNSTASTDMHQAPIGQNLTPSSIPAEITNPPNVIVSGTTSDPSSSGSQVPATTTTSVVSNSLLVDTLQSTSELPKSSPLETTELSGTSIVKTLDASITTHSDFPVVTKPTTTTNTSFGSTSSQNKVTLISSSSDKVANSFVQHQMPSGPPRPPLPPTNRFESNISAERTGSPMPRYPTAPSVRQLTASESQGYSVMPKPPAIPSLMGLHSFDYSGRSGSALPRPPALPSVGHSPAATSMRSLRPSAVPTMVQPVISNDVIGSSMQSQRNPAVQSIAQPNVRPGSSSQYLRPPAVPTVGHLPTFDSPTFGAPRGGSSMPRSLDSFPVQQQYSGYENTAPTNRSAFQTSKPPSSPRFDGYSSTFPSAYQNFDTVNFEPEPMTVVSQYEQDGNMAFRDTPMDIIEPLLEGTWVKKPRKTDEEGLVFNCQTCLSYFEDRLSYELHMNGLRHMKNVAPAASGEALSLNDLLPTKTAVLTNLDNCEAVDIVRASYQLDQMLYQNAVKAEQQKKLKKLPVYSEVEERLLKQSDPVLGVDYLTEYRHLEGKVEYLCNLCDVVLESSQNVLQHTVGLKHLSNYICYHDSDAFKSITSKNFDINHVKSLARDVEKKCGRSWKMRLRSETTASDKNTTGTVWNEIKNEYVRPVSSLPGHRLNPEYVSIASPMTVPVDNIESLLEKVSTSISLANGKPPSRTRKMTRLELLNCLAKFEINSDKDAEVCLQLANSLTLSLLRYRLQMIPSLDAVDVSKLSDKLKVLQRDAEAVADKTSADLEHTSSTPDEISSGTNT